VASRAHPSVKPMPSLRACRARPSAGGRPEKTAWRQRAGNDAKSDFLGGARSPRPRIRAGRKPGHPIPTGWLTMSRWPRGHMPRSSPCPLCGRAEPAPPRRGELEVRQESADLFTSPPMLNHPGPLDERKGNTFFLGRDLGTQVHASSLSPLTIKRDSLSKDPSPSFPFPYSSIMSHGPKMGQWQANCHQIPSNVWSIDESIGQALPSQRRLDLRFKTRIPIESQCAPSPGGWMAECERSRG